MKRIFALLLTLCMALSLCACGSKDTEQPKNGDDKQQEVTTEPVTLKISIAETSTDIKAGVLADMMAEVEQATDGRIKFEIYYSNELGSLADVTEQMTMGGNILAGTSGDFYADYGCPDIMACNIQYALPTIEAVNKLNDSELFASWCDQIEQASGLKILCCNWASAPRSVLSTKPINSVEDFKGLKIRVPGLAADAFFSNLGASTMTMPFSDIYTNMSQGMVEAAEAPLSTLYSYSLQEVAKYCYLSEHSLATSCWAMSASIWNSLSADDQKILQDALTKYGSIFAEKGLETQAEFRAELETAGVTFVEPTAEDKATLQKAGFDSFSAFPNMSEGVADELAKVIA
jgi:TRAP-type C4-dicarboxylate transport system substrate-binding protein